MLFSAMTYDSMEGSKSMRFQTFFSMRAFAPNKIYNIENTHKLKFQFQFGSTTCVPLTKKNRETSNPIFKYVLYMKLVFFFHFRCCS